MHVALPSFSISHDLIKEVDHVKYLGHIITSNASDDMDILRQCRSLYIQCNVLVRKFFMCSSTVKKILFKSYCYPMYTCYLWRRYNMSTLKKLRVAYNNAFRGLMGYPKYCSASLMFTSHRVSTFEAVIRNLVYKFSERINRSENSIIMNVISSDAFWQSYIRRHWDSLLYLYWTSS